jgi:hypothetical protein
MGTPRFEREGYSLTVKRNELRMIVFLAVYSTGSNNESERFM